MTSHGRERGSALVLLPFLIRTLIPFRGPTLTTHLNRITSQRFYLLIPSHWKLGLQRMCRSADDITPSFALHLSHVCSMTSLEATCSSPLRD